MNSWLGRDLLRVVVLTLAFGCDFTGVVTSTLPDFLSAGPALEALARPRLANYTSPDT